MLSLFAGFSSGTSAASVGSGGVSTAFSQNSVSLGVRVGSGSAFNDDYTILGVSAGYYLAQGLELGIGLERWFSGDPSITKISPQIRYVFTQPQTVRPYIGAFFTRTEYGDLNGIDLDDQDSFGYRAGAFFSSNNRVWFGAGIVYEEYSDCPDLIDCSDTTPEFLFSVAF